MGDMADTIDRGEMGERVSRSGEARAVARERCGAVGDPGAPPGPRIASGEGLRDSPEVDVIEVTRARSPGENEADGERAIPALAATGASISRMLRVSPAVRASTASSRTAGTVCSRLEPWGWWKIRDDLWVSVGPDGFSVSDATAGISMSRSKMADPDEWMLAGDDGRERCPW
jgi:hypothetical protein